MKPSSLVGKIRLLLRPKDLRRAALLLVMVTFSACLEVVGVASVLPFMAVLLNPSLIYSNEILHAAFIYLNFIDSMDFLFSLGVVVFAGIALAQIVKALTHYLLLRFCLLHEYRLGKNIFAGFLRRPYSWMIQRDTATLGKTLLSEMHQVVQGILLPLLMALSQGIAALLLVGLLFIAAPNVALIASAVLGFLYLVIYRYAKPRLDTIGRSRFIANEQRYLIVSDALGAAKEVKAGGLEKFFISRFSAPAFSYAINQASAQALLQVPRSVVELIAIGGMLLVVLHSISSGDTLATAVPMLSLYAFAAYRLMPALQHIYVNLSEARYNFSALEAVCEHLSEIGPVEKEEAPPRPMRLDHELRLDGLHFYYPASSTPSLNGLTLSIKAGSTVGIVGASGCGKSTAAAILVGLLAPEQGTMTVDGEPINPSNASRWRSAIGYVPQQIYLSNDSVAANIAFGVPTQAIDLGAVKRAAIAAQLHEFVCHSLPNGYETVVGERGVRLSGGQRQRIAIARALYREPKVLVLDEATSALDNVTERLVMDALEAQSAQVTTVLIAHRLSTVKRCAQIVLLKGGKAAETGTYDELLRSSETFRNMVNSEARGQRVVGSEGEGFSPSDSE